MKAQKRQTHATITEPKGKFVSVYAHLFYNEAILWNGSSSLDMAHKMHSMISPKMVRRLLMPTWTAWIQIIKAANLRIVVEVDSDGYVVELLPLWVEAGFDACSPMKGAAGNDIVTYRQQSSTRGCSLN